LSCCCGSGGLPCAFSEYTELQIPEHCTYGIKGKKAIGQRFYECKTCGKIGCCQRCMLECHKDHELVYCGFKRATCACGVRHECRAMPTPIATG
jgi:hypothetical protein